MKQWLIIIGMSAVIAGMLLYSAYNRGKETKDKEWQKKFQTYEQEVQAYNLKLHETIEQQTKVIDSLKAIKPKIITKYVKEATQIDSSLAQDSTKENATRLYRTKLSDLSVKPDTLPDLTVREIGWGAKFFLELQAKRELLLNRDDVIMKQDDLISSLTEANKGLHEEIGLLKLQINNLPEEEDSFWEDRFPVIIGGGIGYDINQKTIVPTVGIYFGIRIN